jgi:hypothetical protein
MNFRIIASGETYKIKTPIVWASNTWHRIKASYQINSGIGTDGMTLFLDGYQPAIMSANNNLAEASDGYSFIGNIIFSDPINDIYIGTDYSKCNPIFALIDNLRISNLSRPIYAPYGEPIDVGYSSNLNAVFPVTKDLYTTYLMDFDATKTLITNFATLINRSVGAFDFTVNIFDSFGIVASSAKVKEVLETLLNTLKPASNRIYIKYVGNS